jgi:hypothetical protein
LPQICQKGLDDVFNYLENEEGEVAVFDATNTTKKRRRKLYEKVVVEKGFKLFFVESICFDKTIIESNIREVKVMSPDYAAFSEPGKKMFSDTGCPLFCLRNYAKIMHFYLNKFEIIIFFSN